MPPRKKPILAHAVPYEARFEPDLDGPDTPPDDGPIPSKTRRKKDMQALQDLGEALVALSPERLARLDLSDTLAIAIADAKRFTAHEARRRQMQYIGRLMRHIDPAPIQATLDALQGQSREETARQHRLERLRDALMDDEKALTDIVNAYPGADVQHLRNLRRKALKEREQSIPPRAYRELFRELRQLDEEKEAPSVQDEPQ
jgi:ribosome-associated protein